MATISHTPEAENVKSIVFKTNEYYLGRPLYFTSLSGVAQLGFQAVGKSGKDWKTHLLRVSLKIPLDRMRLPVKPKPEEGYYLPKFRAKHWTVYAGLNRISNKNTSYFSGYAVNGFRLKDAHNFGETVVVEADLAVRDSDGYVEEVGFQLEMLLVFMEYRKIVIT